MVNPALPLSDLQREESIRNLLTFYLQIFFMFLLLTVQVTVK